MGRKKLREDSKKISFGVTLDPRIMELLEIQSEKEGLSKSQLIENALKEKINKN